MRGMAAPMSSGKRVLVVDDDPAIRDLLSMALEGEGYHVECARNGHDALDKVRRNPPNAILLDIMMPTMDGWCFLRAHHTLAAQCRAPVLVMTAAGGRRMARELGAADFLPKPFDLDTLLGKVAALC